MLGLQVGDLRHLLIRPQRASVTNPRPNIVQQEIIATCSLEMPRYYFDLVDSKTVADEEGQDLPDDVTAMYRFARPAALRNVRNVRNVYSC